MSTMKFCRECFGVLVISSSVINPWSHVINPVCFVAVYAVTTYCTRKKTKSRRFYFMLAEIVITSVPYKPLVSVLFSKTVSNVEVADNNCVYRNEIHHSVGERTQVLQDVAADPTLPRTKSVRCANCGHGEAVFFQATARGEEGMTLFFVCCNPNCGNRWRD
ncbi:hypothetical protein SASPL_147204 [Salvia splendens]|uniref:TFIIS-type domain-containing protein n=1 Tax=Salvia splendens TaxID=180675 RepID=A0A8X8WER4_SALSN|nr:hypothetical protein SASPL_147204 [Salvia splendens]